MKMKCFSGISALAVLLASSASAETSEPDAYLATIEKTAQMTQNPAAQTLAQKLGLQILDVTWEDTGRFKGSSVGPNISDMTIQVLADDGKKKQARCMPVVRFPNFSDKTADLDPTKFSLLVGNESGQALRKITLDEFLKNPTLYLHDAGSWRGEGQRTLFAPERDSKVLVSAQACFLPIPKEGKATFNPVLFNYQAQPEDPAVLTILVTREGTSTTIIDNTRDAFEEGSAWGQRLFFNQNGERASLTGQRQSDSQETDDETKTEEATPEAAGEAGLNMVLLIQVPLKQRNPQPPVPATPVAFAFDGLLAESVGESDVENAVIGHGELEGPFTEIADLPIERDDRFPVRVTVQFYKGTSNGVVSEKDLQDIKDQIDRVYAESEFVGSLVTESDTGRTTEYDGPKVQPEDWWDNFWTRHENNTGDTREEAIEKLKKLLGRDFHTCPVSEGYLTTLLASTSVPEHLAMPEEEPEKKGIIEKLFGQ